MLWTVTRADPTQVHLKLLIRVLPLLDRLHDVGTERDSAGNRRLHYDQYVKLALVCLSTPLIDSVAMLQRAAEMPRVARKLGTASFSRASFSEAPVVFDPSMLQEVIRELVGELRPLPQDPRLSDLHHLLTLVDGTLLSALPKLAETYYRSKRVGKSSRDRDRPGPLHAWKLHTQLDLSTGVPRFVRLTPGIGKGPDGERRVLEASLEPGRIYVLDRFFYEKRLLQIIMTAGAGYVVRLQDRAAYQIIEERPLTAAQIDAGVRHDRIVRIEGLAYPTRLVIVRADVHMKRVKRKPGLYVPSSGQLLILTSDLKTEPELISLIYRYRWTIEVFFKFFKGLLGCRHLLSQRRRGVEIQVYCAVIICVLLNLTTGLRPSKAVMEALMWHVLGLASVQDVQRRIEKVRIEQDKREEKSRIKKLGK
jgi:DDE family transposase